MRPLDSPEQAAPTVSEPAQAAPSGFALEKLFDVSPDAVFVTDTRGIIQAANPRAAELFGYGQVDFVGQPIESLIPERFRPRHPEHRENFNAHPRARQMGAALNLFALRKDGTEFPVDIMLKPLETPSGPVVLSILRDVTEQRHAQEELRRADLQLRSMIESVRDYAIYVLDKDGYVASWNPGAERIKGYSAEEVVGSHYSRFFTDEDRRRNKPEELLRLAAARGRLELEGWRIRKDGSRFWANVVLTAIRNSAGELTGYTKVTRDFTDRKRAEEAVTMQLTGALLANQDVSKLLAAFSAVIGELIPHDAATLGLPDSADDDFLRIQFLGSDAAGLRRGAVRVAIATSPAGQAFRSQEPVVEANLQRSPYGSIPVQHLTALGMQSACYVPLIHRGNAIGTLAIASKLESAFGPHEVELLAQVATQVAMAVSNAVTLRQIAEMRDRLAQERQYLEEEINLENRFEDIVGESAGLRQVLKEIETVAPTNATVLIQGETGTGKELLARAIHRLSPRSDRTFIKLNCASIPAGLLESELFGHEKGAFTGAISRKVGRLELAHEGTLFLDEVGELPLELQPKLLRALQEREIERIGGTRPIAVNIRLIAATNRDLAQMVAEKTFRSDLFYRLKVFPVFAPPLRQRDGDIPVLVRHFVSTHSRRMGKMIDTIPDATMAALTKWSWPGNIRELENFLERAVILTRGSVLYVPLAELQTAPSEDEEEELDGRNYSYAPCSGARSHPARVARHQGADRRTRRRSHSPGPQTDHPQLQNEEARHRAR